MSLFSGKTIIVTGGAQGIGRGIVEYLLGRQAQVVVADIDREAGDELQSMLVDSSGMLWVETDVGNEESVHNCVERAKQRFGGLDGLINNAGIAHPRRTPLMELDLDYWEKMLRTNLTGAFLMVKHGAPYLKKRKGAIVNISSTRALQSEADTEAYSASKGGLLALTHALAVSFSGSIRVNAILPGWIDVSGLRKTVAQYELDATLEDHLQHPAGRIGTPNDIASLAAYLLSEEAGFITGQSFVVDGGMTSKMIYV